MSPLQNSLNQDLIRLREKGYRISIKGQYLVIRDVPYVNSAGKVCRGILVSKLDLADTRTVQPGDHTIMFSGEHPCHADGSLMQMLGRQDTVIKLDRGLEVQHTFSRRPLRGHYVDYFEKIETYVALLLREAAQIEPGISVLTGEVPEPEEAGYPFNYPDTFSSRAEINIISQKLSEEKVAIIGLGGTGSYILDLVAKTPVKEIHLFDSDTLLTHNAFRSPGAPSNEELREQRLKVRHLAAIYSKMKRGITVHEDDIDAVNVEMLRDATFVFLCVDRGVDRKLIIEKLEEFDLPFVDVGMGLYSRNDVLGGKIRVTTSLPGQREFARANMPVSDAAEEDIYDKNIQIAELNAMNACLAVIRWKKFRGFYHDDEHEQLTTYTIGYNMLMSENDA